MVPGYEDRLVSYSCVPRELLDEYKSGITEISNPTSKEFIKSIIYYVDQIEKENENNKLVEIN